MKVGFIGVGKMGAPIARRIADGGFRLAVWDRNPAALEALGQGVEIAADPVSLASAADVVGICVRTDADLADLVGDGELFSALGAGGVLIIHSTVSPDFCRKLAIEAKSYGVDVLDAGVSGGVEVAAAGKLLVLVGGDEGVFERARPVLATFGDPVHYLGPSGRGMEAKLINNLASIANYEMAAATLELGEALGFDREALREALLAGSAGGFAMKAIPRVLAFEPDGRIGALLRKDYEHAMALALNASISVGSLAPAAEALLVRLGAPAARHPESGT